MGRPVHWYDYITINIYYLGLTTLSQTSGLITPLLVQDFVGEEFKATFYGNLRLWSLMTALLVQAGIGILSDRSASRFGRRRPFIFVGTILALIFFSGIGLSIGMDGLSGYWFLFIVALALQFSASVGSSAQQGLIPDLVPEDKRGRFSGVKAILELPIPLLLVFLIVARSIDGGNIWGALIVTMVVLLVTMLITMLVPEKPLAIHPPPLDWTPFLRLLLMTGLFTAIILGMGNFLQLIGRAIAGISSPSALFVSIGVIGLTAMLIAIGLGVWACVRIGLGAAEVEHRSFTWWIISRLAFLVGVVNLSTFAVFYLQARLGFVRESAVGPGSTLILIVGVAILLFALSSGWLADRFGHKKLVILSGLIASLGTLTAIRTADLTMVYLGGALIGAATGVFFTASWALGTRLVPKAEAARFLGISNLAGAGSGAVGAYIGGPIADYFTRYVPEFPDLGYILLFGIYGVLFLLSAVAISRVRTPSHSMTSA